MEKHHYIRAAFAVGFSALSYSAVLTPAFAADSAPSLEIENFIGRITIVNGDDVSIKGEAQGTVRRDKNMWYVDGEEKIKQTSCRNKGSKIELSFGNWSWRRLTGGYEDLNDYPHLKVTLPRDAHLKISESVIYGDSKDLGAADISLKHCSDLALGSIAGALDLNIASSADVKAEDVGTADISVKGSGDVSFDAIGDLNLSIIGSGDFNAESVTGRTVLKTHGSGDIEINELHGSLKYNNQGSGDLWIDDITATDVQISLHGSGDAEIMSGSIETVSVSTNGSGDVAFKGRAGDVGVRSNGSSDVYIRKSSGDVHIATNGSGSAKVNGVRYDRD